MLGMTYVMPEEVAANQKVRRSAASISYVNGTLTVSFNCFPHGVCVYAANAPHFFAPKELQMECYRLETDGSWRNGRFHRFGYVVSFV